MEIRVANTLWKRMRGLIGLVTLPDTEALYFPRCRQVHTWGMRFPIDIVWVGMTGEVQDVESVAPWRISRYHKSAYGCIEVASGVAAKQSWKVGATIPECVRGVDKKVDALPRV